MNTIKRTGVVATALMLLLVSMIFYMPKAYGVEGMPYATSLTIDCGKLVPEFQPDVYEYTVYVDSDAENKSCVTTVEFDGDDVGVNVQGPVEFENEDVTKTVTLSDSDGDRTEYTINVHIAEDDEVIVDGMLYSLITEAEDSQLPPGFTASAGTFDGQNVKTAVSEDGNVTVIPFASAENSSDITWYTLNDNGTLGQPMEIREWDGQDYMLIEPSDNDSVIMIKSSGSILDSITGSFGKYTLIAVAAVVVLILLICILSAVRKHQRKEKSDGRYFRTHLTLEDKNDKGAN